MEVFKDYQGVLFKERGSADLVAGTSYGLDVKVLLELTADWDKYRPKHELQFIGSYEVGDVTDTSSCVSFSATDILEAIFIFFIRDWLKASGFTGNVTSDGEIKVHLMKHLEFATAYLSGAGLHFLYEDGYMENGQPNFSDRFVAINGHTTGKGAFMDAVANGIKYIGLVPEKMLPMVRGFATYHDPKSITEIISAQASKFKKFFDIDWEWVNKDTAIDKIKESPLQGTVLFANGDGVLEPAGAENHAIMIYKLVDQIKAFVDDSYTQQSKEYGWDYFHNLLKYSIKDLNINIMDTLKFVTDNDLVWVQNEKTGQFARIMQKQLRPIVSSDKGALILLDDKVRGNQLIKNGKRVPAKLTEQEWALLPKKDL